MGCITSKDVVRSSSSYGRPQNHGRPIEPLTEINEGKNRVVVDNRDGDCDLNKLRFGRSSEAEHVAAGWPSWLSAVAGEAIHGWLPLKSDGFQRLEKVT